MTANLFQLPDEILATLSDSFPCRAAQIRSLATLLYPQAAPCRNLIVHGTEATGKTAVTSALLAAMRDDPSVELRYAVVKATECVTARHLYERTISIIADALAWDSRLGSCETLAALTVELSKLLSHFNTPLTPQQTLSTQTPTPPRRFVLVFDAIDRQRDAPPLLLPGLARLSEIIPSLTTVFILTAPAPALLRTSAVAHLYFPPYTKTDYAAILSLQPPPPLPNTTQQETSDLWTRFTGAVHDSLVRSASRTLPSFQQACAALWPRFTAPVAAGTHKAKEFSKLLIAARVYFQDESVLEPKLVVATRVANGTDGTALSTTSASKTLSSSSTSTTIPITTTTTTTTITTRATTSTSTKETISKANPRARANDLAALLPPTARLLLMAAYLASHNAPRHDSTLFSTWHNGKRRRGGGISVPGALRRGPKPKHRKIARKLLGPGVFVMERMMAIYLATRGEWVSLGSGGGGGGGADDDGKLNMSVDGDVGMAIATLASLRLLVRVGGMASGTGDMDRGGRWRVNVGWELIRGIGRSMGVEVEEWLVE
ncbi:origin recognition complex subunit 5 C-terminus-domain-containing protein [Microdochium trichocladiopsis]|uniref:Origin recognition complex subunit 5 C-terminus-domain-containing protein n=1 Tax=Microdochium trichocladiopsis TaxID=1682393 RepID=A0A9P8XYY0_9PEZI|nr:origin recognition complex subunit 5 C-terminus-domain-containing protein [Microdochium trichocladiopsis]KAH7021113.1 origin recognition complex subunit 5 C-terminus-domain-containing protein [Microdochium trichocladiopsis]